MEDVLLLVFYFSFSLFIYNYFIYPAAIIAISKFKNNTHVKNISDDTLPSVSFIIAAYNEGTVISDKILNTLSLDYPREIFQIIVVSDGSNDETKSIVESFKKSDVLSLHNAARNGKSAALNRGVEIAKGEIIVFSDANNDFSINSIRQLVKHFNDPIIGAVTGAKHIYDNNDREAAKGDGFYWKYESKIKKAESDVGSITGAEGEILAVRKCLYIPIEKSVINDDAAITFSLIKAGYRVIYEGDAKAYEQASINLLDDFNVKVRMTAGGFQTLSIEKGFLFPPRNWFSFTFISHKILRWFAPHFLIVMLLLPILLLHRIEMIVFVLLQTLFYIVALVGWLNRNKNLHSLIYVPMYFTVMNIALFTGFIRFINNNTKEIWKKAER